MQDPRIISIDMPCMCGLIDGKEKRCPSLLQIYVSPLSFPSHPSDGQASDPMAGIGFLCAHHARELSELFDSTMVAAIQPWRTSHPVLC
ncbi:hypothetical protein CLIM01_07313 [Colletotrichum limetticola]|uniref:Uncharacterized protein n=1 Tax=Colletotrichum limetticola TaxID=1209924 RepID=A0ABQ9PUT4_9PEZI|nr:hypothetical protein CLIM01_07313 [Colletotrichum limetticola]